MTIVICSMPSRWAARGKGTPRRKPQEKRRKEKISAIDGVRKRIRNPPMYLGGRSELGPRHSAFGMRCATSNKANNIQNKKQQQRTAAAPRTPQEKQQQSSSNNNNTNNKARWYSLDRDPSWPVMMFRLTW